MIRPTLALAIIALPSIAFAQQAPQPITLSGPEFAGVDAALRAMPYGHGEVGPILQFFAQKEQEAQMAAMRDAAKAPQPKADTPAEPKAP